MYNNTKSQNDDDLSMDEILASIRRYVADEQQQTSQNIHRSTPSSETHHDIYRHQPENIETSRRSIPAEHPSPIPVVRLTAAHEIKDDAVSSEVTTPVQRTTMNSELSSDILSPNAAEAATQSLHRLKETSRPEQQRGTASTSSSSSQSVEHFIVSLMKPLIKRWLDENLPSLVERMVQKEIQKITNNLD